MRTTTIALASILWIAAVGAAPPRGLPQCVHGPFRGITMTDPNGESIGTVDANDWGCADGTQQSVLGGAGRTIRTEDVPVPPPAPGTLCLHPAAPNPMTSATRLRLTIAESQHILVTIHGQRRNGPLRTFEVKTLIDATLAAGVHEVVWDGTDAAGARVAPGIYRVLLQTDDHAICGDIEVL